MLVSASTLRVLDVRLRRVSGSVMPALSSSSVTEERLRDTSPLSNLSLTLEA
jgi:hypothetical protein